MKFLWKRKLCVMAGILVALALWGRCLILWDYPYAGRVVDKETGEPIEGAVVVAEYWMETPSPAGPGHAKLTWRETVTDWDGRFRIPFLFTTYQSPFFYLVRKPEIYVLALGYGRLCDRYGSDYLFDYDSNGDLVARLIRRRSRQEAWDDVGECYPYNCPIKTCPKLFEIVDTEYVEVGLDPLYYKDKIKK